ncbi:hypothetical protein ACR780_12105 [Sphingobacterium faecium]|uniref:hypothetical protein n=1 Tax=Sphingobacterium faecium TaxID=34087 RepID=UPI003DA516CA
MDNKTVTVILNIWKRNYVEEQIDALLNQTHKPEKIWIIHYENYVETNYLKSKDPSIEILHSSINLKYFGRFSFAQYVDIMVILTPLLDILTPLFRISSVQLMT